MAQLVLTNAKCFLGGYDISGILNATTVDYKAELVDATTFGASTRKNKAGVRTWSISHSGYWDTSYDQALYDKVAVDDVPASVSAQGAEGDDAFFGLISVGGYQPGASYGDLLAFTFAGSSASPLVRGNLLALKSGITASANGTGYNLGAAGSKKLYAALHVFAASGTTPSLTVKIQSDADNTWASPTDEITFTAQTAVGSQMVQAVTPVDTTDGWWRATWTVSGTSPSFDFAVVFGML